MLTDSQIIQREAGYEVMASHQVVIFTNGSTLDLHHVSFCGYPDRFLRASEGGMVEDLDGNRFCDLTGSYGVNVLGVDAYKACMAEGANHFLDKSTEFAAVAEILGRRPCSATRTPATDAR